MSIRNTKEDEKEECREERRQRISKSAKADGNHQRMKAEENHQRVKRQCAVLGVLILFILIAFLIQKSKEQEPSIHSYIAVEERIQDGQEDMDEAGNSVSVSDVSSENVLVLVNKDHALPEDYAVELHWLKNRSCAVSELMYDAFCAMLSAGSVDGKEYVVASGYRSKEFQQQLLEEDIAAAMQLKGLTYEEAYEQETRETMPPGYSEHETGLAVDLVSLTYQMLDEGQERTAENRWLQEHCSEYGFILRYPENKEEVTGVAYESWHFRFVGKEAAQEIMSRGITLEEYLGEG